MNSKILLPIILSTTMIMHSMQELDHGITRKNKHTQQPVVGPIDYEIDYVTKIAPREDIFEGYTTSLMNGDSIEAVNSNKNRISVFRWSRTLGGFVQEHESLFYVLKRIFEDSK